MEYTQQEIANFTLLKDAFVQRNQLYDDREALYELVRQTPKVLLMEYTEDANKYILFAMLERRIWSVVDHIKNCDIDPIQAVSLRGNSYRDTLFDFAIGETDEPEFRTRIFSIVHETQISPDLRNAFLDACVEALMFTNDDYDDDTPFTFLSETLFNYLDRIERYESDVDHVLEIANILNDFTEFLTRDNNVILNKIQDIDGFGQESQMRRVIDNIKSLKKLAERDDSMFEIVQDAANFLDNIGAQQYDTFLEIANFNLLKNAFLQENELYNDRIGLYLLVRQTPQVLLMKYADDKSILFAMLEAGVWSVVDHIKNGDINPFQAVLLRENDKNIFHFGIGSSSEILFIPEVFSIYHDTDMLPGTSQEPDLASPEAFRDACVDALLSPALGNTPLELFAKWSYQSVLEDDNGIVSMEYFHLFALLEFSRFLAKGNFDVIRRLEQNQGATVLSEIHVYISSLKNICIGHRARREFRDEYARLDIIINTSKNILRHIESQSSVIVDDSDMSTSEDEPEESESDYVSSEEDEEDELPASARRRPSRESEGEPESEWREPGIAYASDAETRILSDGEEQYLFQTLNIQAELGVTYSLRDFRRYTLPDTKLVMEINDEDCDVGDVDTKKEYPVKINVSANGVEWDRQGTSADAKLYIFCASDLKNWLNTHTGYNTFGEDSVYLENQALHDKNPFNNKTIYGVEYLTQEEIDEEMQKYDTAEDTSDYQSQLQNQISDLRRQIDDLARQIEQMDTDKNTLDRRKRFLEIQLRQKQATLNIMRQPTNIKLKL